MERKRGGGREGERQREEREGRGEEREEKYHGHSQRKSGKLVKVLLTLT